MSQPIKAFTQETAIEAIRSHDTVHLTALLTFFKSELQEHTEVIKEISSSSAFLQALSDVTSNFKSDQIFTIIYQIIEIFLPLLPEEEKVTFIDTGFEFCLPEALNSENVEFLLETINFISFLSKQTDYAIDTFFSFGIHTQLLDIAEKNLNNPDINSKAVARTALKVVFELFGEQENILSTILQSELPRITKMLLECNDIDEKKTLLQTITEITNQRSSFSFILFESEAVSEIYKMLDNEELITTALPLIGNLCLSSREHVQKLIDMGLVHKLMELRQMPQYSPDAYWCLSNVTEAAPDLFSQLAVNETNVSKLVDSVLIDTKSDQNQLRKEATFFLASLILYISRNFQNAFIKHGVFQALVSVLDITNNKDVIVVLHIFDVFIRLFSYVEQHLDKYDHFMELINETHLTEKVERIAESEEPMLVTKAHEIQKQFQELQEHHAASK